MKKRFNYTLAVGAVLVLVYATAPLWSLALIRTQLPPGWQLVEANLTNLGFKSVEIEHLQLATSFAGKQLMVSASAGKYYFSSKFIEVTNLSIDAQPSPPGKDPSAFSLQELSLPLLVWPETMPSISIDEFNIDLGSALPGLHIQNLELGGSDGSLRKVSADFFVKDLPSISGRIETKLSTGSLEADIYITSSAGQQLIEASVSQNLQGSEVQADINLDEPELPWLAAALFPEGPDLPGGLSGNLVIKVRFGGQEQLIQEIHLASPGGGLQLENEDFFTAFGIVAAIEGQQVLLSSILPGNIRYEGKTDRLSNLIKELIPELSTSVDGLSEGARQAELKISQGSSLEFELDSWREASFAGAANLAVSTPAIQVDSMTFSQLAFQSSDLENLDIGRLSSKVELSAAAKTSFTYELGDTTLQADGLILHSRGGLILNNGAVRFDTAEPLEAELNNMVLEVRKEDGAATLDIVAAGFTLETMLTSDNGSVTMSGSGAVSEGRIDSLGINAELVNLNWNDLDLDSQSGYFDVKTEGLKLKIDDENYQGVNPKVGCEISANGEVGCKGLLAFGPEALLPVGLSGNTENQRWDVELLPASIDAVQSPALLSALNLSLPEIIKINQGMLHLEGAIKLDPDLHGNIGVEGDSISFSVRKSEARNLNFTLSGELGDEFSVIGLITLESATLAAGLDIDNLGAGFEVTGENSLAIDSLTAELFGGALSAQRLQFIDGVLQDSLVRLLRSDLSEMLTFADIDGISGTGTMEIQLPLSSDEKGMFIRDGSFNSTGPGILSYAAADPAVVADNIGLQALANFHYTSLDGTINYSSGGEYRILAHLAGNNPDLYDGYPIELNINIGGELPELFEVLFITGDFEEAILERIRIK